MGTDCMQQNGFPDDMKSSSGLQKLINLFSILIQYVCHKSIHKKNILKDPKKDSCPVTPWARIRQMFGIFQM